MSDHSAVIQWNRNGQRFIDNRYSRLHQWQFDGGAIVPGSASPHNVSIPLADSAAVDPEEAFVAALASCHMLWFLNIAAKRGYCVESYRDAATGVMARNTEGRVSITTVTLRPHAAFTGAKVPTLELVQSMHDEAHAECFLANSVKSHLVTIPTFDVVTETSEAGTQSASA